MTLKPKKGEINFTLFWLLSIKHYALSIPLHRLFHVPHERTNADIGVSFVEFFH